MPIHTYIQTLGFLTKKFNTFHFSGGVFLTPPPCRSIKKYPKKSKNSTFKLFFKKQSQKWPTRDVSNIERNKVIKNQPIWGIP